MSVEPLFAQWLQSDGLMTVVSNASLLAIWGDDAQTSERMTTLAHKADAEAEAARQLDFLGGPLVIDTAELRGTWTAYIGEVITLTHDDLGYDGGVDVFVIGAEDRHSAGTANITFLRRL